MNQKENEEDDDNFQNKNNSDEKKDAKKKKKGRKIEKNILDMESSSDEDLLADDEEEIKKKQKYSENPQKQIEKKQQQKSKQGGNHPHPDFKLTERQKQLLRYCRKLEQQNLEQSKIKSYVDPSTSIRLKQLIEMPDFKTDLQAQKEVASLLVERVPQFQMLYSSENSKDNFIKLSNLMTIQYISYQKPVFSYNESADNLYILLSGQLATYVPKSELVIDKEIKLKYEIMKAEKIYTSIALGDKDLRETYPNARKQLKFYYEIRKRHSNQEEEIFLREATKNSARYFRFEQELCTFRKSQTIIPGETFGMLAIARDKRQTSSVLALQNSVVIKIPGWYYSKIFKDEFIKREVLQNSLIQMFPSTLFLDRLNVLAYEFREIHLFRNQTIFQQNDYFSDTFYYIFSGRMEIMKAVEEIDTNISLSKKKLSMEELFRRKTKQGGQKAVCASVLESGEFFGHEDLLQKRPRSFTARSISHLVILFEVPRSALLAVNSITFLKILKQFGMERSKRYQERIEQIFELQDSGSVQTQNNNNDDSFTKEVEQKRAMLKNELSHVLISKISKRDEGVPIVYQKAEEDPKNDKNLVFGDIHDFQKLRNRTIKRLESNYVKGKSVKTFHQKGIRPNSIQDIDQCVDFINSLPSLTNFKNRENFVSQKDLEKMGSFEQEQNDPILNVIIYSKISNKYLPFILKEDGDEQTENFYQDSLILGKGTSIEKKMKDDYHYDHYEDENSQTKMNNVLESVNDSSNGNKFNADEKGSITLNQAFSYENKMLTEDILHHNNHNYHNNNSEFINGSMFITDTIDSKTQHQHHSNNLSLTKQRQRFSSMHLRHQQLSILKKNRSSEHSLLSPILGRVVNNEPLANCMLGKVKRDNDEDEAKTIKTKKQLKYKKIQRQEVVPSKFHQDKSVDSNMEFVSPYDNHTSERDESQKRKNKILPREIDFNQQSEEKGGRVKNRSLKSKSMHQLKKESHISPNFMQVHLSQTKKNQIYEPLDLQTETQSKKNKYENEQPLKSDRASKRLSALEHINLPLIEPINHHKQQDNSQYTEKQSQQLNDKMNTQESNGEEFQSFRLNRRHFHSNSVSLNLNNGSTFNNNTSSINLTNAAQNVNHSYFATEESNNKRQSVLQDDYLIQQSQFISQQKSNNSCPQKKLKLEEYYLELPIISQSNTKFPHQRLPNNVYSMALQRNLQNNLCYTTRPKQKQLDQPNNILKKEIASSSKIFQNDEYQVQQSSNQQEDDSLPQQINSNELISPYKSNYLLEGKLNKPSHKSKSTKSHNPSFNKKKEQQKGSSTFDALEDTNIQQNRNDFLIKLQQLQEEPATPWSEEPSHQLFQQYLKSQNSLLQLQQNLSQQLSPSKKHTPKENLQIQGVTSPIKGVKYNASVNTGWNDISEIQSSPLKSPSKAQILPSLMKLEDSSTHRPLKISSIASGSLTERANMPCVPNVLFPIFSQKKKKKQFSNMPQILFQKLHKKQEVLQIPDVIQVNQQQQVNQQVQSILPLEVLQGNKNQKWSDQEHFEID